MFKRTEDSHWDSIARRFDLWTPPLRPSAPDISAMERAADQTARRLGRNLAVALWGVTPEIAEMRWPPGTRLTAIELAADMIRCVWPGDRPGVRRAVRGDWVQTPDLLDSQVDLVIGDGCFNTLAFPHQWRTYAAAAHRAMVEEGSLVMRFYVQLPRRQSVDEVLADLQSGRVRGFHTFKFQLAMAIQGEAEQGVRLNDVWELWQQVYPQVEVLIPRVGWSPEMIGTIGIYRGQETSDWFPTFEEVLAALAPEFQLEWVSYPDYEMGDRCPLGVFSPADPSNRSPRPGSTSGTDRFAGGTTP